MPKVVIELQANTQAAVQQIQTFAKAQRDAFDAIRAGNPALEEATVKVSKLTESQKGGAAAAGQFNKAAQTLAQSGVRELATGIPVVDDAVVRLASNLKGFPLLLGGIAAAGVGLIVYLQNLQKELNKTADAVGRTSDKMQADFLQMQERVKGIRAGAAGRPEEAAVAAFEEARRRAEQQKKDDLEAARTARQSAVGIMDALQAPLNPQLFFDKLKIADAAYQTARVEAEQKASNAIFEAREQLKAKLVGIEADLDAQIEAGAAKQVEGLETVTAATDPVIEKMQEINVEVAKTPELITDAGEAWLKSMEGISSALDEIIAKTRQARGAAGAGGMASGAGGTGLTNGGTVGGGGMPWSSLGGGTGTVLGGILNQPSGSGLTPFNPNYNPLLGPGQQSGKSPGDPGYIPGGIFAPSGSTHPVSESTTIIQAGAVQITGTVIDQQRDWDTLVSNLGQSIAAQQR